MGLIQTPDQLRFSYQAIIEGAKQLAQPACTDTEVNIKQNTYTKNNNTIFVITCHYNAMFFYRIVIQITSNLIVPVRTKTSHLHCRLREVKVSPGRT